MGKCEDIGEKEEGGLVGGRSECVMEVGKWEGGWRDEGGGIL